MAKARPTKSRGALRHRIEADRADEFSQLKYCAYRAIAKARSRISNDLGLYTPEQVEDAKNFLRTLHNESRNTGRPRGDKPKASENQNMLRVFYCLWSGDTLKQIAIDAKGPDRYEGELRSLHVRTKRFSERVYEEVRRRYGCDEKGRIPSGFLDHRKSWRRLTVHFGGTLRWPGVRLHCNPDGYALCEALRRHKPGKPQKKPWIVRSYMLQIGPP